MYNCIKEMGRLKLLSIIQVVLKGCKGASGWSASREHLVSRSSRVSYDYL